MASGLSTAYWPKRPPSIHSKARNARRGTFSISALHVLLFLFAFRIVNALTLRTLYVPDEYYQSLEPAWHLAFGPQSGAWITWVGRRPAKRNFEYSMPGNIRHAVIGYQNV
jgi:phosphatidylinositol glycan class B